MNVKIILPTGILLSREISRLVFEGVDGSHGILPNHIDFVNAVVPGILRIISDNREEFLAVDNGIIIKEGDRILLSTRSAIMGAGDIETLRNTVRKHFHEIDEYEKRARKVLRRLEGDFLRRFFDYGSAF